MSRRAIDWTLANLHQLLEFATVLYLTVPILLFFYGWLKLPFAAIATFAILGCLFLYYKSLYTKRALAGKVKISATKGALVGSIIVITLWTVLSGIGGFGHQNFDYNKHNAVIADLTHKEYPVYYDIEGQHKPLVYYVSYYLPAAVVGKVVGDSVLVTNVALLLWSLAGVLLVLYWLARLTGRVRMLLVVLFILFSGADILGYMLVGGVQTPDGGLLEWYSGLAYLQYPSFTTSLFWTPQLAIPSWLLAGLLGSIYVEKRSRKNVPFLAVLSIMWSPFITVGLIPFYAVFLYKKGGGLMNRIREMMSPQTIISMLCLGSISLLFLTAAKHSESFGLFTSFHSLPELSLFTKLIRLPVFIFVEFGFFAAVILLTYRAKLAREWYALFVACTVFLVILPLFRYGYYNDLVIKASIPALLPLFVVIYKYLTDASVRRTNIWIALVVVICFGALTPLVEFRSHLTLHTDNARANTWQSIGSPDIPYNDRPFRRQYLGESDAPFFKYLAP